MKEMHGKELEAQGADRSFGRPIDRGLHTQDGRWVHVREAGIEDLEALRALRDAPANAPGDWLPPDAAPDAPRRRGVPRRRGAASGSRGRGTAPQRRGTSGGEEVNRAEKPGWVLMAWMGGQIVGWLSIVRHGARHEADLAFGVDPSYRRIGIGSLLMDVALEWAREQPGLQRLCVQVQADNLPVSSLCCSFGFVQMAAADPSATGDEPGLTTLSCYL